MEKERERVLELTKILNDANYDYYVNDNPKITDQEFDKYLRELEELEKKYQVLDIGTNSTESVDFPFYGFKLGEAIKNKEADFGIAICGTGIGISIACNKVKGIMCAKINSKEEARLAKEHNNANVIAFSGNTTIEKSLEMINTFIESTPLEDSKYQRRINEILDYENEC